MVTKKEGWIKIGYDYYRTYYDRGSDESIIATNTNVCFANVKKEIMDYCKSWKGKGKIDIKWIELGPCSDYKLTDKQKDFFNGKVYKFNN